MRAALLFTLLLTLVCLASGNSVPSFVRQDRPSCSCLCRPGRRGRRRAFRDCRQSIHCEVTRCQLPSGGQGSWCCDDGDKPPTPSPTPSMTTSVSPSISMTPEPSVTPEPFPKQPGVLCLRSCGVCADLGCRRRNGGRDGCCPRFIRNSGDSCTDNSPPCILD